MPAEPRGHRQHGRDHRTPRSGDVAATVDPGGVETEGLLDRGHTAFTHAHPDRAGIGGQAIDVLEVQSRVGHRFEAGVDGQREGVDHQPPSESGSPHAGEDGVMLESTVTRRPARGGEPGRLDRIAGGGFPGRLEHGQPDIVDVLEADDHLESDADVAGIAPDDIGGQAHGRVLGERHHRDGVGRGEVGGPLVLVDGVPDHGGPTGDRRGCRGMAATGGADRNRWVDQRAAVRAALDAELPVGAGGPEPSGPRGELGKRSHRDSGVSDSTRVAL